MNRQNNIIIRPLLTEKSNSQIEGLRKYAFQVLPSANKNEIDSDAPLAGKILVMLFEKPSTRTLISFDLVPPNLFPIIHQI